MRPALSDLFPDLQTLTLDLTSIFTSNGYTDGPVTTLKRKPHSDSYLHQRFPWLATLCKRFEDLISSLLAPAPTIIQGEYTPSNVLIRGGIIYPIAWEPAAIALGEIDLGFLIDRWPEEIVRQCELEYQLIRRPTGSPTNFECA